VNLKFRSVNLEFTGIIFQAAWLLRVLIFAEKKNGRRNVRFSILIAGLGILALIALVPGFNHAYATLVPATPAISTTQQPATAPLGAPVADMATVTGGYFPTGTVTFNFYNNPSCSSGPVFTDTENLVSGSSTSAGYLPTSAGTYYWVATYNGDSNNNEVTSPCGAEPVVITGATGVPEFPVASLGLLFILALLLPALLIMGRKFRAMPVLVY